MLFWTNPENNSLKNSCSAPILQTIQVTQARQAGHFFRSKNELISNILWWIPTFEPTSKNLHVDMVLYM